MVNRVKAEIAQLLDTDKNNKRKKKVNKQIDHSFQDEAYRKYMKKQRKKQKRLEAKAAKV